MVDIHCHIVPGVDDGAADIQMSLAMIEEAKALGITAIATTPHFWPETDNFETLRIQEEKFTALKAQTEFPIQLCCEVRVNTGLLPILGDKRLTYGHQGKYILLELPSQEVPTYFPEILFNLRLDGITPIIAHPERNFAIVSNPASILEYLKAGAHLQLTAGAVTGTMGPTMKAICGLLIRNNLASIIASDAHNLTTRPFSVWQDVDAVLTEYGVSEPYRSFLTIDAPEAVVHSKPLSDIELTPQIEQGYLEEVLELKDLPQAKRKRFFFF